MVYTGITKSEIEEAINSKGDFMQIDYLLGVLKKELPLDVKKFVNLKLAGIYDKKAMFEKAAKVYDALAIGAIAFSEKVKFHVRETEAQIKAGNFIDADRATRKAMGEANSIERDEIYYTIKDFYKKLAEDYEQQMKRNRATKIYEKLLNMRITDFEKKEIKNKLIGLYEKLGKFTEAKWLEGLG